MTDHIIRRKCFRAFIIHYPAGIQVTQQGFQNSWRSFKDLIRFFKTVFHFFFFTVFPLTRRAGFLLAFAILLYSNASFIQYSSFFFVVSTSASTNTKPFITLPVKSIGLHPSFSITSSYFAGSNLTMSLSFSTPTHILSFTIKHKPPNIAFSSTFLWV